MDKILLDILACPICKGKLIYCDATKEFICKFDKLAYPVRDNIPVMLPSEARHITDDEVN